MNRAASSIALRLFALAFLTATAAALTFGYLGRLHPALDSFSHFRVHLAVLMALTVPFLLILKLRVEALFAAALAVATLGQTFWAGRDTAALAATTDATGATYRLLQLNVYHLNQKPEAVLSLIGEVKPDVVTLNEISLRWKDRLAAIEAAYPYQTICSRPHNVGSVAILSRRPFAAGFHPYCAADGAMAHVRLDFGGRPVEVVAIHLGWPWPYDQQWQAPKVAALLGQVGDTAILAGDLNAVPWSHTARQIEAGAQARILRGIGPTWLFGELPAWLRKSAGLPIDNVMVKGKVTPIRAGAMEGGNSDHLPVLLEFMLEPEDGPTLQVAAGKQGIPVPLPRSLYPYIFG